MRKDDSLAAVKLNENGLILRFSVRNDMYELLPLEGRQNRQDWLKIWWKERAIPVEQGRIARFLESKGFTIPEEYLMRNLGFILTNEVKIFRYNQLKLKTNFRKGFMYEL
jgi:hypothetical protein